MLFQLVYASTAVRLMEREELLELLSKSRANNERLGITGMLLYKDGNFMQALEGPEDKVKSLHARIDSDPRHKGLITLFTREVAEREFPDWSMGFKNVDRIDPSETPGYTEFLDEPLTSHRFQQSEAATIKLLTSFKRSMR